MPQQLRAPWPATILSGQPWLLLPPGSGLFSLAGLGWGRGSPFTGPCRRSRAWAGLATCRYGGLCGIRLSPSPKQPPLHSHKSARPGLIQLVLDSLELLPARSLPAPFDRALSPEGSPLPAPPRCGRRSGRSPERLLRTPAVGSRRHIYLGGTQGKREATPLLLLRLPCSGSFSLVSASLSPAAWRPQGGGQGADTSGKGKREHRPFKCRVNSEAWNTEQGWVPRPGCKRFGGKGLPSDSHNSAPKGGIVAAKPWVQ